MRITIAMTAGVDTLATPDGYEQASLSIMGVVDGVPQQVGQIIFMGDLPKKKTTVIDNVVSASAPAVLDPTARVTADQIKYFWHRAQLKSVPRSTINKWCKSLGIYSFQKEATQRTYQLLLEKVESA